MCGDTEARNHLPFGIKYTKAVLEIPVFEASLVCWEGMGPSCHPPLLLNKSQITSKSQLCELRARLPL